MRRKGSFARLAVVLVSMTLLAAACSSDDDSTDTTGGSTESQAGGVFRIPIGEPSAIDPYNARESEGTSVNKALFVGLVTYDGNPELKMRPGWPPSGRRTTTAPSGRSSCARASSATARR